MGEVRLTFASFTYAGKARKMLLHGNVKSKIIKLDAEAGGTGCTHGLVIQKSDFYTAVGILRKENINYRVIDKSL